ncbi:signal transduction histidine kinase [Actinocrispum wychmicini]|uniref:Oxygen sensor histidine kinase NreB n=1 Tax=Actinocrispum wychmicini TaxID=1213861 RepID=A0A4V2S953_9PSEU|nr:signal transduction histidine kinase [Actinocrispum wychmicini]
MISVVTAMVYSVVLLAGLYYAVAGLSPGGGDLLRLAGFVAGLVVLYLIERKPRWHPVRWLIVRVVLYAGIAALDESGLSRALFVLVPFVAYLTVGRRAALWLGAACLAALLGGYFIWMPGWYTDANYLSDVLMFAVGLTLALTMAHIAVGALEAQGMVAEMTAEVERTRIARDIHDTLGHHLTAITVQLEMSMAFRDRDPEKADRSVANAYASARRALTDVRSAVRAMHSGDEFDLPAALQELVRDDLYGELKITGAPTAGIKAESTLYRAAQESITNARRHGKATKVSMALTYGADTARLVIADNGCGFDIDDYTEGFGLQAMRERAELIGGHLQIDSKLGKGTQITVTVPA